MRIIVLTQSDGQTAFMRIYNDAVTVESQIEKYMDHPRDFTILSFREITKADIPSEQRPDNRAFRNALMDDGTKIAVDMPKARSIHAENIAIAQVAEIGRLKVEERKERLKNNTAKADAHAATLAALEALDLNILATQIINAPNTTALSAVWPVQIPRLN